MSSLLAFHELAAAAGDGLHPDLVALFERQRNLAVAGVENLADHMQDSIRQAGPNPGRSVGGALPSGVLAFPRSSATTFQHPAKRRSVKG